MTPSFEVVRKLIKYRIPLMQLFNLLKNLASKIETPVHTALDCQIIQHVFFSIQVTSTEINRRPQP